MKEAHYLLTERASIKAHLYQPTSKKIKLHAVPIVLFTSLLFTNPVFAAADLDITRVQISGSPKIGNCNVVGLGVRNIGNDTSVGVHGMIITHPRGTPLNNRVEKKIYIAPLKPGGSTTANVRRVEFPTGSVTLTVTINPGDGIDDRFTADDIQNNTEVRQFRVSRSCSREISNRPATGQCDLELRFAAPAGQTINRNTSTRFVVTARNVGTGSCPARRIKLVQYNNATGSGSGRQVGGSGAGRPITALQPNRSQQVEWLDQLNAAGSYSYKASFTSPHNDTNNNNHLPLKQITVR